MEAQKRGPGRPPLPPDETRPEVYQLRMSSAERDDYLKASKTAGLSLAEWMRDRLNKAVKRESKRD